MWEGRHGGTVNSNEKAEMNSKMRKNQQTDDPKPRAYKAVRVWLSDGTRILGMWTGTNGRGTKGEIQPVKWEREEEEKEED